MSREEGEETLKLLHHYLKEHGIVCKLEKYFISEQPLFRPNSMVVTCGHFHDLIIYMMNEYEVALGDAGRHMTLESQSHSSIS